VRVRGKKRLTGKSRKRVGEWGRAEEDAKERASLGKVSQKGASAGPPQGTVEGKLHLRLWGKVAGDFPLLHLPAICLELGGERRWNLHSTCGFLYP
jgi:hypothetical protein